MRYTDFIMTVYKLIWKRNMLRGIKTPELRSEWIDDIDEIEQKLAQHILDEFGEDYNVYEDVAQDMHKFLTQFPNELD